MIKSIAVLSLIFVLFQNNALGCSMYKITTKGKTRVGCNHDTWFYTPKIWFEKAGESNKYGAAFTGARQVSKNRTAPQSGMNEVGLTFSRLASFYPKQENPFEHRIQIKDEVDFLSTILHQCATVSEVKTLIEQYDHSVFRDDVFIYIDKHGDYLIVEPYHLILGSDSTYLLSNFCPSITNNQKARNLVRYRNGDDFLRLNGIDSSLAFSRALSDTMHVCRNRNGDGTLLTSIWDTKEGNVDLYFYHDFDYSVRFNLLQQLAKGDHTLNIPDLFPENEEFIQLKNYQTPFNTPFLRIILVVVGAILTLLSLMYLWFAVRNRKLISSWKLGLIALLNLALTFYLFVLATNVSIYYFDAPYVHYESNLITYSSYLPFLLLVIFIPFTLFIFKTVRRKLIKRGIRLVFILNHLIYLMLMIGFTYWGFYQIWI